LAVNSLSYCCTPVSDSNGTDVNHSIVVDTPEDDELTACAYRCDPDDPFLDAGICYNGDCPSPDSSYVQNTICWGLPFQPSPGDIELHDEVPFESSDGCNAYLTSWMSSSSSPGKYTGRSDKTSYPDRGQMWQATMGMLEKCVGVPECQGLVHGNLTGQEVQDCINKCSFEYGEEQLEKWICDYATASFTGGLATFFCNSVLGVILQPVNKFLNKFIEQPVINVVTKVEDAVQSIGSKIAHFFHFGHGIVLV